MQQVTRNLKRKKVTRQVMQQSQVTKQSCDKSWFRCHVTFPLTCHNFVTWLIAWLSQSRKYVSILTFPSSRASSQLENCSSCCTFKSFLHCQPIHVARRRHRPRNHKVLPLLYNNKVWECKSTPRIPSGRQAGNDWCNPCCPFQYPQIGDQQLEKPPQICKWQNMANRLN